MHSLAEKLAHLEAMLTSHLAGDHAAVRSLLIGNTGLERLETFRTSLTAVRTAEYALATYHVEQFRVGLLVQLGIVLALVLTGAIWTGMLGAATLRNILRPVAQMIDHVNRIAETDFVGKLPIFRRDEIGQLAVHINLMTDRLRKANDDRESARSDLAVERQNLIDAVAALDEGFAAFDDRGVMVQCNEKYRGMFPEIANIAVAGVSYETLLRRRAERGSEPECRGREQEWIAERLAEARESSVRRECEVAEGRIVRRSSTLTRSGGRVAVYVDLTQLKRAEARLRELNLELDTRVTQRTNDLNAANLQLQWLNAEMRALIVSAPVAIIALDLDRAVTTWNPAAYALTGLTKDRVAPDLANIIDPADAPRLAEYLTSVYGGDHSTNVEFKLRHRDGAAISASISASMLADGQGAALGVILIVADLTDSRALQHQFQQSQKLEVVAELTAGLAHDFNNLLGIVISNLDMLEKRIPREGLAPELLAAAMRASLSGVALNQQLLAFSRHQSLQPRSLDVEAEMRFLEPLLHPTLGEQITCTIRAEPGLWQVLADPSLLQSAILNLAVNARDAMPDHGSLTITAHNVTLRGSETASGLTGDFVQIEVADTGEGMPPDVIARAFEPFFTTKGFGKGSGLGLSMVYGFVKQSAGDIIIDSTPGQGTRIRIFLPRAVARAEQPLPKRTELAAASGAGETILLVEDNDDLRHAMALTLRDLGFDAIEANGAGAALRLLEGGAKVDVMLTDIVMPGGMDGRALAREAARLREGLPIIFMSGFPATTKDGTEASWEDHGIPVLTKPVPRQDLNARIIQLLR